MTRTLMAILLAAVAGGVSADSWLLPTPVTAVSDSGAYRLTVYPRQLSEPSEYSSDKVDGKEPASQRAGARAQCEATLEKLGPQSYEVVWRKPLVNDVAPLSALVADDGRFVTFDNWHHVGIGEDTIAIYRADGTLVKTLRLEDVVSEDGIRKLRRSVSSVWWGGKHRLSYDDATIELQVAQGSIHKNPTFRTIRVELSTGDVLPEEAGE